MKAGFTILELLLVIFLFSVLLLMGLPAWQNLNDQLLLNKEQQKLALFLRQLQARVENSQDIWLLIANRDLQRQRWCFTAQVKDDQLCDCLAPQRCPSNIVAQFYYPASSGHSMLISKRYYPREISRFSGIRDTVSTACFVLQVNNVRTVFSLFNVGSVKLKTFQTLSACQNDEDI